MDTKNFKQAEETFRKSAEDSMKWFSESAKAITATYNKQLELSSDIYKKFMEASLNAGKENNFKPVMELFHKRIELFKTGLEKNSSLFKELIKTSVENFSKSSDGLWSAEKTEMIMKTCRKQLELLTDSHQDYFDMLSKQMKEANVNIDWKKINEKFHNNLNESMEASQASIKSILESYKKQADTSSEANKKLLAEINKLIDTSSSTTVAFWKEMMETIKGAKKDESKKYQKNGSAEKSSSKTYAG